MAIFNWGTAKAVARTYLLDWAVIIVMLVLWFCIDMIHPFLRLFSINDRTIQYPYAEHEKISDSLLAIVSIVAPWILITIVSLGFRRSSYDWHQATLGLLSSLILTLAITFTLKNSVGRLRPDFIDRCQPRTGTTDPAHGLLNILDVCTQADDSILRDGSKSFPSGHASEAFAGLGFLALYIAGKISIFDRKSRVFKGFLILIPNLAAAIIGVTRIEDYRHHWEDVVVGSLIGIATAYFAYRQFYPALGERDHSKPFPIRGLPQETRATEAASAEPFDLTEKA